MAGFTSPSILFLSTWDGPERAYCGELLPKLLASGYTSYNEPSVGGFAMPLIARDAGWKPEQMDVSDTHLFTSILGEVHAGRTLEGLGIALDGEPLQFPTDDPVDQAAFAMYQQYLARMEARPEGEYWSVLIEDLKLYQDKHIAAMREKVESQAKRLSGLQYRAQSMWDHLERVADDPKAVIISNPPTYRGAYEKFYDTKERLTWNTPDYEVFDAPVDIPRMVEFMEGRKALLVVQQQQTPGDAAHAEPVYARQLAPSQLVFINSNRPEEVKDLMGGIRAVRRKQPQQAQRPYAIIPQDYEVREDSRIDFMEVESKVADAYRHEWMHRLYPVPGSGNVLILIDGYAAGVIGYSLSSISSSFSEKWAKHAILRFAFGAPHDYLRLTRFATMFALQHSTLWETQTPLSSMAIAAARGLVTIEMTRHPEAKGLRGLMKLDNRQKHPDGYKLVYASDWHDPKTPSELVKEFLTKERAWRKQAGKPGPKK
nr:MAG TPA: colicin E8 [Caudoviricetes sp.]